MLLERESWSGSSGFAPSEISRNVRRKGHISFHHHSPGSAAQLLPTASRTAELSWQNGRYVRDDCTNAQVGEVLGEAPAGCPELSPAGSMTAVRSLGLSSSMKTPTNLWTLSEFSCGCFQYLASSLWLSKSISLVISL